MAARAATRVAALYDIHGNLPALHDVLSDPAGDDVDTLVIGGDVVLGPMPRETLEVLRALEPLFVRGNCDRLVVDAFDGRPLERVPASIRAAVEWTAAQLDREHRDLLASWPETLVVDVEGIGEVLFCHATPRSDEEIFTALSPEDRVRPMFAGVRQRVVVCGHTHMQFDRSVDGVRVVNAGSVGMPFAPPGAYWLRLGPDVRLVRTECETERTAALVRATAYPQAEQFLHPFTEEQALALFEPAAAHPA